MRPRHLSLFAWIPGVVIACVAGACDTEGPDVAENTASLTSTNPRWSSPLDAPPAFAVPSPVAPSVIAEAELVSGRLHDVPATTFYKTTKTINGSHSFAAKVSCTATTSDPAPDPGLIVHVKNTDGTTVKVMFNAEALCLGGCTTPAYSAWLFTGARATTTTYDIYAFSQKRSTAPCDVFFNSTGSASAWTKITGSPAELGGTLVHVGALATGEFLEVQTPSDGNDDASGSYFSNAENTKMLLFDLGAAPTDCRSLAYASCTGTNTPVYNLNRSATDFDPRIKPVASGASPWLTTENYVLLGKESSSWVSNEAVETRVELVKGPLEQTSSAALTPSPAALTLARGTYLTYVYAQIAEPVGSTASQVNPIDGFCRDKDPTQENAAIVPTAASYQRGRLNTDDVLTLTLWKLGPSGWTVVTERGISRGAFGGAGTDGWERFVIPVDTSLHPEATQFKLSAAAVAGVTMFPTWYAVRNADSTELKVVTYNQMGDDISDPETDGHFVQKMKNSADLLGGRGQISTFNVRVVESADQARFQWDADLVAMQEVPRAPIDEECGAAGSPWLPEVFRSTAEGASSSGWAYAYDWDEQWSFCSVAHNPGLQVTFVRDSLNTDGGILFSNFALNAADCVSTTGGSRAPGGPAVGPQPGSCRVQICDDCGPAATIFDVNVDVRLYSLPTKAAAQRGIGASGFAPSADRPIAVFNYHPWQTGSASRREALDDLIGHAKLLMQAEPGAFNKGPYVAGVTDAPKYSNQRFIIVGDFNLDQGCGEGYSVLRRLREEFGYALDVSLAVDGSGASQLGQHDRGLGVSTNAYDADHVFMPFFPEGIRTASGSYRPGDAFAVFGWTDPLAPGGAWAIHDDDDLGLASDGYPRFPWWARTYRDTSPLPNQGASRLDAIILVGKGWAYDDPAQAYRVLWDKHTIIAAMGAVPNPASGEAVADCIEQWDPSMDNTAGNDALESCLNTSNASYRPRFDLNSPSATPVAGAPALHSDHQPVGVRLRVWHR